MNNTKYISEAFDALTRNKRRSTQLLHIEEKYGNGGLFQKDILIDDDEISSTTDKFVKQSGERVLLKVSDIKWVENISVGTLVLTDQRIFYTPQFYDAPLTTKNLEINLDSISKIGHYSIGRVSSVIIYAGDQNSRIEFTSAIPFKLRKFWSALKPINKKWKILRG